MTVVTTPHRDIGHHVIADLLAADTQVRVIVRNAARLPDEVRDRVQVL